MDMRQGQILLCESVVLLLCDFTMSRCPRGCHHSMDLGLRVSHCGGRRRPAGHDNRGLWGDRLASIGLSQLPPRVHPRTIHIRELGPDLLNHCVGRLSGIPEKLFIQQGILLLRQCLSLLRYIRPYLIHNRRECSALRQRLQSSLEN